MSKMKNLENYRLVCEAQGLAWADYADLDEWSLSMLFDSWEEDEEDL